MTVKLANNASAKLASPISASATTLSVMPGQGGMFPAISTAGDWFPLTIVKPDGSLEIVKCTGRSTDSFTVDRAQEGTPAQAWDAGDRVELRMTKAAVDDIENRVTAASSAANAAQTAAVAAQSTADSAVSGLSGKANIASPEFTGVPKAPTAASGTATTQLATTAFVNDALGKASGIPLLFPLWCPNRAVIPAGYAPADGQTLARSLYPDAWAGIAAGNVPVATDAAWLATPTERGKFTAGDGSTTFRLPDYNGKSAGSIGAVFMRGDGSLSAGASGVIQGDAIRNITGNFGRSTSANQGIMSDAVSASGVFTAGAATANGLIAAGSLASYRVAFDASRVVPTAAENRPLNVTGCWVIRLFGAVVNPGAADAAQLATEVSTKVSTSAFQGTNQSLASSGYQKLPGGLILQWGAIDVSANNALTSLTFPIAFPFACRAFSGTVGHTAGIAVSYQNMTATGVQLCQPFTAIRTVLWTAVGY